MKIPHSVNGRNENHLQSGTIQKGHTIKYRVNKWMHTKDQIFEIRNALQTKADNGEAMGRFIRSKRTKDQ